MADDDVIDLFAFAIRVVQRLDDRVIRQAEDFLHLWIKFVAAAGFDQDAMGFARVVRAGEKKTVMG